MNLVKVFCNHIKRIRRIHKIENDIATLNLDPSGDYNVIEISKDITTLVNEIEKLLSTTLSPLRYSKILPVIKDNTALRKI